MKTAIMKHRDYLRGDFDLTSDIEQYLAAIEKQKSLNAFTQVYADEARQRAHALDQKRSKNAKMGPLAGVIVALKDNICMKDHRVTCASKILENFISPYDATVVRKIIDADGVIIGKTNLDEFAMGSSTENSFFGPARHPQNPSFVAGGSSGGSAVAVAAGLCDVALGSDTGGSIRQPASFCGIIGLKPTYGRVSRYGLVAYASSLDQIGTFGRTVDDAAMLLQVISGHDASDSTSAEQPVPDFSGSLTRELSNAVIGVPRQFFGDGLEQEIRKKITGVVESLKSKGFTIRDIDLPLTDYAIATYYIVATAEASSNLSRYDGVRYGFRAENAEDLDDMYSRTRSQGFNEEVKRRIMLGTYVLSSGYYDAYYKKGMQVRRLIKQEYDRAFAEVDVLITPTTPSTAFKQGKKLDDPLQMYLSDIYTVTANLAGICAMSVPAGNSASGMPIGLQLIAGAFQEEMLLKMGKVVEKLRREA